DQMMGPLAKFEYPINDSILTVTQIRGARPAPNGRQVAFIALDALYLGELTPARGGLGAAKLAVGNPRRPTRGGRVAAAPSCSADGRDIANVTWTATAGGNIYRARSDGSGQPERLTRAAAYYAKIAYTKDGSRIMAVRGSRQQRMRNFEDFGGL